MSDDVYDSIRRHMNSVWPLKLPKHQKILALLKMIFPTEEEAKIISLFEQPFVDLKNVQKIAKMTGLPPEKVEEVCAKMVEKGTILKTGKKYGLLAIMPGLFEFFFIAGKAENLKETAELFHTCLGTGGLVQFRLSLFQNTARLKPR
jgi:hypothetical protein